jgi:GYF domain 2
MATEWHLLKASDHEVYGPIDLEQLRFWAAEAKVSPLDKVSNDSRESWVRAPMIPELQMDWLIEMPDNYLYGPTSVGAIQEFLATGDIDENVVVINCLEGESGRLSDQPFYRFSPHQARGADPGFFGTEMPSETDQREALSPYKGRIQWLEKQVMELQYELGNAEDLIASLRSQFIEATGHEPR